MLFSMKEHGVSWIVVGGDLFDKPSIGDKNYSADYIIKQIYSVVEEVNLPVIVIEGNHDWNGNLSVSRALASFTEHRLIYPVFDPKVFNICDVSLFLFPWHWLTGKTKENISKWKDTFTAFGSITTSSNTRVFVGHLDTIGSHTPYGIVLPGSSITVSDEDLLAAKCDYYFLGHIHNRQSHYVGAPWQLNHGESQNPCGWALLDTETKSSSIVDLYEGPRYITVGLDDYEKGNVDVKQGYHYRTIGSKAPNNLRSGDFAKIVKDHKQNLRRVENPNDLGIEKLVKLWCNDKNVDYEKILPFMADFGNFTNSTCIGDLLSVNCIKLRNIGPHKDFEFQTDVNWCGISGRNGSGKSLIVEAMYAALYGVWVNKGHLNKTISGKTALVEVELTNSKGRFIWQRSYTDNKWSASVAKIIDDEQIPVVTGIDECTLYAEKNIASRQTLLWSSFISQPGIKAGKDEGRDILSADPSKRMDFLRSFMGLDMFDSMVDSVKDTYTENIAKLGEYKVQFSKKNAVLQNNELLDKAIEDLTLRLDGLNAAVANEQKRIIEITKDEESIYKKQERAVLSLETEYSQAIRDMQFTVSSFTNQKKILDDKITKIADAESKLAKVPCKGLGLNGSCLECPLIKDSYDLVADKDRLLSDLGIITEDIITEKGWLDKKLAVKIIEDSLDVERNKLDNLEHKDNSTVIGNMDRLYKESAAVNIKLGELLEKKNINDKFLHYLDTIVEKFNELDDLVFRQELSMDAFGRDGVPQLIIESNMVFIQEILDKICEEDYNNRFRLEIVTQGKRKKGSSFETFSIDFIKGDLRYSVELCSGGEFASVKAALRVALIIYQAQRTAGGLRVAFLDEPTAHQDEENIDATLKMLNRLHDYFNQIFVVSHDADLLSIFPHRLCLS